MRGIPAYIVVPSNAPKCKVKNVVRYGGEVIWCEPTFQSRQITADKVQQDTGAVLIHPYNDSRIIRYYLYFKVLHLAVNLFYGLVMELNFLNRLLGLLNNL